LFERVHQRTHDASDADVEVIRLQRAEETGMVNWHRVDASLSEERVLQEVKTEVEESTGRTMSTAADVE
jgi:predicted kinase